MPIAELVLAVLRLVVELVGREKAQELLSLDAVTRANAEADLVEILRFGQVSLPKEAPLAPQAG